MQFGETQSGVQNIANFAEQLVGVKPIFSGGLQIGSWWSGFNFTAQDQVSSLCTADVTLNDNLTAAQMDPHTWMTWDDLDQLILAQDYCLQRGVTPSWMTAADLTGYQQNADGSITPVKSNAAIVPLAIAGGLILLSVILIARR